MRSKPVIPRRRAELDIQGALDHFLAEAGSKVADSFLDALERSILHISRHPASGSSRYAHELNFPGLRHWRVEGFPYLVFYMELESRIEVWRVLHGQRDIPSWMQSE